MVKVSQRPAVGVSDPSASEDGPPLDPEAVARAYELHRARREARKQMHLERRGASVRFWFVFALVLVAVALLAARTLGEIEQVFGL